MNKKDLALLDDIMTPDYFNHTLEYSIEDEKKYMKVLYNVFPDYHVTIEDIITEGDKVCVRTIFAGTHKGEYLGLLPTGKKITSHALANLISTSLFCCTTW